MNPAYYHRAHLPRFGTIAQGAPPLAERFFAYYGAVFASGALGVREKALVALAVAHALQCPYCIDAYTSGVLEAGGDLPQMTEAVHVAAAVRGASTLAFGAQMVDQARALEMGGAPGAVPDAYFSRAHADAASLERAAEPTGQAWAAYEARAFEEGALPASEKHVIALGVAHALQCPYGIERHTRRCQQAGVALDAMMEAVHAACAIRAGASLIHGLQMLEHVAGSKR